METSSLKHTPGPWVVTKDLNCNVIRGAEETRRAACGTEFPWRDYVASTWGGANEANAHLIAAAPEMLELLQEIAKGGWNNQFWVIEKARATIAKATGSAA